MRRAGFTLFLSLAFALGAAVAPALAEDAQPPATTPGPQAIPDGVRIGPVAVGGMTAEQATAAVVAAYLRPVQLRIAGKTVTVSPRRFGIAATVAAAVQRALSAQPGAAVPLRARVDASRVAAYVAELARRYDRAPVNARLVLRRLRPVVTKPRPGLAVKLLPTRMLLRDALRDGTRTPIVVPTRKLEPSIANVSVGPVIVIRRAENRLLLYRGAKLVRAFHVATGQSSYPTPLGRFQIVVKWRNPWWYPPASPWAAGEKPVPPGPGNPLGTRWMGLSAPGVGIHGTPDDASVGYSLSHGCIRMHIPEAEWLFDHVTVGTPVYIVPQ